MCRLVSWIETTTNSEVARPLIAKPFEVIPRVYQLPMWGSGAFVLLEDRVTVIDAGWRGQGGRVLHWLKKWGRSAEEISHLFCTHYHLDHVGGVAHVKNRSRGLVAAHESEVAFLRGEHGESLPNPVQEHTLGMLLTPFFSLLQPARFSVDLPLRQGEEFDQLGGMQVIHTPGHTPGSISLLFPREGLLLVGDALQFRRGQLALPSPMFSADMEQAKESIRRLSQLEFETVGFSHFPPLKKDATSVLRQFAESLD